MMDYEADAVRQWASSAHGFFPLVSETQALITQMATAGAVDGLALAAQHLISIVTLIEQRVGPPPNEIMANHFVRWVHLEKQLGEETLRAARTTGDLGPAGELALEVAAEMRAMTRMQQDFNRRAGR